MNKEYIMNYAFNQDTKFILNAQKMIRPHHLFGQVNKTSCNYPNLIYQKGDEDFLKSVICESPQTLSKKTKHPNILSQKEFLPLSIVEILEIEGSARKLSATTRKIKPSILRTPLRHATPNYDLSQSLKINLLK